MEHGTMGHDVAIPRHDVSTKCDSHYAIKMTDRTSTPTRTYKGGVGVSHSQPILLSANQPNFHLLPTNLHHFCYEVVK